MEFIKLEHYDGKYYIGETERGSKYICDSKGQPYYGPLMEHQLKCLDEVIWELDELENN